MDTNTKGSFLRRKLTNIQQEDYSYSSRFRKELEKMKQEEALTAFYLSEGHDTFCKPKIGVLYSGSRSPSLSPNQNQSQNPTQNFEKEKTFLPPLKA